MTMDGVDKDIKEVKPDKHGEDKKKKEDVGPAAMRLNIAPAPAFAGRVVGPVVPVPTYSPAYKHGGMVQTKRNGGKVRGCGVAVKGHGKMKVY